MKVGFIGAGRVGISLGKYLSCSCPDFNLVGYYSKTRESSEFASSFTDSDCYLDVKDLISLSDVVFITTNDDEICNVWNQISRFCIQDKIICHCSGSLSSDVFKNSSDLGAYVCSMHPMMAIASKEEGYLSLSKTFFTLEGDDFATATLSKFLNYTHNQYLIIKKEQKIKYHEAAVFASNLVVGLIDMSVELLAECGFSKGVSLDAIRPLVEGNIKNIFENGIEKSLTGPVSRGDFDVVFKHRNDLYMYNQSIELVYSALSKRLEEISKRQH